MIAIERRQMAGDNYRVLLGIAKRQQLKKHPYRLILAGVHRLWKKSLIFLDENFEYR